MSSLKERKSSKTRKVPGRRPEDARAGGPEDAQAGRTAPDVRPAEIVVGRLVGLDATGGPLVDYAGNPGAEARLALATATYTPEMVGHEVALMFLDGDPARPLVLGAVQQSDGTAESEIEAEIEAETAEPLDATVDGKRVRITGRDEIVLKCGKASLTLTRAGKVLIRGAYLLSRSSGVNRIKGGSVQIN